MQTIKAIDLKKKIEAGEAIKILDVRTPAEFDEMHVSGSKLSPVDALDPKKAVESLAAEGKPVYVMCRSGKRASTACEKFKQAGLDNAVLIEGGILACDEAGIKLTRGKKTLPLDQQVRIASGSFVLLGVILTLFYNPFWILLSGFVGAGLIYSGITGTCRMAKVLSYMPWNQNAKGCSSQTCSIS